MATWAGIVVMALAFIFGMMEGLLWASEMIMRRTGTYKIFFEVVNRMFKESMEEKRNKA